MIRVVPGPSTYFSVHTHSKYSYNDALPEVADIVAKAKRLNQPAVGLTDHGNMAGSVELYQQCLAQGLKPFPGSELYLVRDRRDRRAKRFHVGVLAHTTQGYRNLVKLSTHTHQNFHHKPLIDLSDMAQMSEEGITQGLTLTTGCYFGLVAQTMVTEGHQAVCRLLNTLASWWPSLYVELQNHHIDHGDGWNDDSLADALHRCANEVGLPVVITQDSHYIEAGDKEDHDALKQLVSYGSDTDDAVFPGDGFHMVDEAWMTEHHHRDRLRAGLDGLTDLLDKHDLAIPALDEYHYRIPQVATHPDAELRARVHDEALPKTQQHRLDEELEVIEAAGMSSYMLLTAQVCDYITERGIYHQTRGSAGGSLVCRRLGITNLDPLKWGLRFERFLTKDRTKPPDIDLDIEHNRRQDVISWLEGKYVVHQIGTWSELSMSGDEDGKGSLKVKYFSKANQNGQKIHSWAEVSTHDQRRLYALSERKAYGGYGKHPAGLVITSTAHEFDDLVPLMWIASSKAMVTQYGKDEVEALGLVKLDVLGSKTLTVIGQTLENLDRPRTGGLDWIPNTDKQALGLIRSGDTDGIFQLEGWSARKGVRKLKPTAVKDVIAAMALFRPATMSSGATEAFIARKHRREKAPSYHQVITEATKATHGVVLYQDQVIVILRKMGLDPDQLTEFLKAVKSSNKGVTKAAKIIAKYTDLIHRLGTDLGMDEADMDYLDAAFTGFAEYSFNLAHSTIYGLTAYRCAYLAVHHGLEFHAALLSVAAGDKDKEPGYIKATKRRGVKIIRADVNASDYSYSVDRRRKAIRKGLLSIHGVGKVAADELVTKRGAKPYEGVEDLISRVEAKKVNGAKAYGIEKNIEDANGTLRALYESGALDTLPLSESSA